MPELPEVETALRGIKPHLLAQQVTEVIVRHYGLRWPIPADIATIVRGQTLKGLARRGKYLLLEMTTGTLILHLGMSGSLRVLPAKTPPNKHDHVDIVFANQTCLRFTDPRRFGAVLWCDDPTTHPLLAQLGPEPLTAAFNGNYLLQQAKQRKTPVKTFIMDSHVVVGVGNIYANEALFAARIHPQQPAGEITQAQYNALVTAIKTVLRAAIRQGGTTLKDFVQSDGKKGYFKVHLQVYGRGDEPCCVCQTPLTEIRLGQRTTVYCSRCQKR